jgi:hypothetical protein
VTEQDLRGDAQEKRLSGRRDAALRSVCLGEVVTVVLLSLLRRDEEMFFKDGLGLIDLKLGLEVTNMMGDGAAVGAATSVGKAEVFVYNFLARISPELVSVMSGTSIVPMVCVVETYQLPFPQPSFLTFLGSTSAWPFFAKKRGRCSLGAAVPSARPLWSRSLAL